MIVALSRFRVRNGLEAEVREAFVNRPRRVEGVPGFLGMEVLTEPKDPAIFWLVTRWTDAATFEAWHRSDEHHASHAFIPKGLKLDPGHTLVAVGERLDAASSAGAAGNDARDAADLLGPFLRRSGGVFWLHAGLDGTVRAANEAARRVLGEPPVPLFERLAGESAAVLRSRLGRTAAGDFLLHVADLEGGVLTLRCELLTLPDAFVLVGEPCWDRHRALERQLTELTDALALQERTAVARNRELARARADLEASLDDLQRTHWHIRKISEVLPICVGCSRVRAEATSWESVADYLRRHALFLTHGYCPACAEAAMASARET